MRVEKLNEYLRTLQSLNKDGEYTQQIEDTVAEINKEFGIKSEKALSSYTTKELHEELTKRVGVHETVVGADEEVVLNVIIGQVENTKSFAGPARILVNQD